MSRSQEARNVAAQARLRAMGIEAPVRGAEYRLRVERAVRAGLTRAQGYGKPGRLKSAEPSITQLRSSGKLGPASSRLGGGGQRRQLLGGAATVSTSSDMGDVRRSVQRAAQHHAQVVIRATVETDKGPRTITLGDGRQGKRLPPGARIVGPVTVTEFSPGSGMLKPGEGLTARQLARLDWDDPHSWADLIEAEYDEDSDYG